MLVRFDVFLYRLSENRGPKTIVFAPGVCKVGEQLGRDPGASLSETVDRALKTSATLAPSPASRGPLAGTTSRSRVGHPSRALRRDALAAPSPGTRTSVAASGVFCPSACVAGSCCEQTRTGGTRGR